MESNDVQDRIGPLGAIDLMQLLEHNLHLLPIGRAHGDEMKTLQQSIKPDPKASSRMDIHTLAFFTSSGVSASKRCDMLDEGLGRMLIRLTL